MPIGYLCQWISYAVFAVVSACCVPVSHANVLVRSAFRAVRGKVILQAQSKKVLDICRAASFGLAMALLLDESLAPIKEKIGLRADSRILSWPSCWTKALLLLRKKSDFVQIPGSCAFPQKEPLTLKTTGRL